jgi:hypothetical protein
MRTVRILARCLLSFVIIVGMLPGCIKYYRVAKTEFPQGKEQVEEQFEARDDIKSVSIYDQFETTAFFDVMWFSEVIRDAYVDLYCKRRGLIKNERNSFAESYESKYANKLIFCILADVRDKKHDSLNDKNSAWSMYVDLGNRKILPSKIDKVVLDPEVKKLFGSKFSNYKKAYQVTFDIGGDDYIYQLALNRQFDFFISSVNKYCVLSWQKGRTFTESKKIVKKSVKDEDYYWL